MSTLTQVEPGVLTRGIWMPDFSRAIAGSSMGLMDQQTTGEIALGSQPAAQIVTVQTAGPGNFQVVAPSDPTKALRLFYLIWSLVGGAEVTFLRFGAAGPALFTMRTGSPKTWQLSLVGSSVQGAPGEAIFVNMSAARTLDTTLVYREV